MGKTEKKDYSIMPSLPDFTQEISNNNKIVSLSIEDSNDLLLLFLSLCYHNQATNSIQIYNFLCSIIEKYIPQNLSVLYAKFHYALLHAPQENEELIKTIADFFSKTEQYSIITDLEQSSLFQSNANKELFTLLRNPESIPIKTKKEQIHFPFSQKNIKIQLKDQLEDFSTHIKNWTFSHKNLSIQELNHPLTDFQKSIQEYFSEFIPYLSENNTLQNDLENFLTTLKNQDYRIAVVGEGKRGKSSLINAILQTNLSLVEESAPKTAVPVEFYFSETETYQVEFLQEKDTTISTGCYQKQNPQHEEQKILPFSCGKRINIFKHQLPNYMDTEGKFVHQTAKIHIGYNNKLLKKGFHLIDTPGLNCINPFHDYLTFKESLQADCIIFTVDARKPDSASELNFLKEITTKGRVISLIGIITNLDRLNKKESTARCIERATLLFDEITRQNSHIEFLGLYALNPKNLMEHFCFNKSLSQEQQNAWNRFLSAIEKAIQKNSNIQEYQQKTTEVAQNLLQKIQHYFFTEQNAVQSIYPHNFIQMLENHKQALLLALEKYRTQAKQLAKSVEKDIENWQLQQKKALNSFEKEFINTLQLKAHEFADSLGNDIAKNEKWKEFDQDIAKQTAQKAVQDFILTQEAQLHIWEEKIQIFHQSMHTLSNECLETVAFNVNSMGNTNIKSTALNNILIHGNLKMKQLSLFLAGAGSGFALSASFFNLVTVGSIALAFLGDPISLSGIVLTGLGAITLHFHGDIQKHKKTILEKKQKKIEEWAYKIRLALEDAIQTKQNDLYEEYRQVIKHSFLPSFELLFTETIHMHWYIEFIKLLKTNLENKNNECQALIQNTQKLLTEKIQ